MNIDLIKEVYDKWKKYDERLSDERLYVSANPTDWLIYDFWKAIKETIETNHKDVNDLK